MQFFISYGHEEDIPGLAHRVRDDLVARGHTCCIDSDALRNGGDWRRILTEGLHRATWTIGFLSRVALRAGGVTLEELAIAQEQKHGCLTTILLDRTGNGWDLPVMVGTEQWLDWTGWRDHRGTAGFEAWYAPAFQRLLDAIDAARPEQHAREMAFLHGCLDPVDHKGEIDLRIEDFVNRDWLIRTVEEWRLQQVDRRLFWLTGAPGSGKSAFTRWITAEHRCNVVALNMCKYLLPLRCDARQVVRTLAFAVAGRVQDYRAQLLRLYPLPDDPAEDRTAALAILNDLKDQPAATLFDRLLAQPLAPCFDGGRREDRLLLVVDGLDEGVSPAGKAELVDMLRELAPTLKPFVGLVVTSRPEEPALSAFAGVPFKRIDDGGAANANDLAIYARAWLTRLGRSAAEIESLVPALVERAGGSFLYLRMLREAHETHQLPLDKEHLPDGLLGVYEAWFRRQFPDADRYREKVAPLLGILAIAETPVPLAVLDTILGWDELEAGDRLQSLGSLFVQRDGAWAPYHKSLRDWLIEDKPPAAWRVGLKGARARLAKYLWLRLLAAGEGPMAESFARRELPAQRANLLPNTDPSDRATFLRVFRCCKHTIEHLKKGRAWAEAIAWCRLAEQLGTHADLDGLPDDAGPSFASWATDQRGDIHILLGRTTEAAEAFKAGLEIDRCRATNDPGNAALQHDLSVSHNRIGDVLRAQGDLPGALLAYRAAMAIAEDLAGRDAGNADWQRDLSVSHNRIGDVLRAQGDLPGALLAYRAAMAIREGQAGRDPGNADWQRDLSVSHNKVGDVLSAQGDLPGALLAYRAAMAIAEDLAGRDPGNAEWQRDLSVSHNKIGDVLRAQGDLPGALLAYRAAMAIAEDLAGRDPGNADWQRDLSVSHNKIGDVLRAQGDLPGALLAYRADLAIAEGLAGRDPGNADWQRDLFISHLRVTAVLLQLGDPAACAAARLLHAQAVHLAASFPHDPQRDRYVPDAVELLRRACGEGAG